MLNDQFLDEADRWVDDWNNKIEARLDRTRALATRLQEIRGYARVGGGLVEVAVDSSGTLTDLHLDEGVRRHSVRWIAEQVLLGAQTARADLIRQAEQVAQQSGDSDTPEGRAVLSALAAHTGVGAR